MYEESLRMPFIVRYPDGIEPGTVNDDIVLNVDFAPTLLDYAGVDTPAHMQGRSFRPLLDGEAVSDWRRAMYYRYWMHKAHHNVYAHYGVRTKRHKLIYYYSEALGQPGAIDESHEPEWELFDLEQDPHEMRSVYAEPGYSEVVNNLRAELRRLQKSLGDTPVE
jgi:arylsulfatase A-like enzyme